MSNGAADIGYEASGSPRIYTLNSAGVGLNVYRENSWLASAAVARKIGTNPDPGLAGTDADGRTLETRFWLQVVKYW